MAVYFAVGTPTDDGRIQDFRMIPPPGEAPGLVLMWNNATLEPEWRLLSELVTELGLTPVIITPWVPLITNTGAWLVTNTGARLVGRALA